MAGEFLGADHEAEGTSSMYVVVFEGTGAPDSNHKGIRTITEYPSKADFDRKRAEGNIGGDIVVAEGVTSDEAHRIASEISIGAYANSLAINIARNPEAADLYFANTMFAMRLNAGSLVLDED